MKQIKFNLETGIFGQPVYILILSFTLLFNPLIWAQNKDDNNFYPSVDEHTLSELKRKSAVEGKSLLIGRALLDAKTFSDGPTSGQFLGDGTINFQEVPFEDKQPVQGFSSVHSNGDGTYWAMSDNGFGGPENSADYNLRVYKIQVRFKSWKYGRQDVKVLKYIELHDPDNHISFNIANHFSKDRILTGADFDIESFQLVSDGTLWFGDEFGPFLIHTDKNGKVIEAPIPLPDFSEDGKEIRSPQNPFSEESSAIRIMNAMREYMHFLTKEKHRFFHHGIYWSQTLVKTMHFSARL